MSLLTPVKVPVKIYRWDDAGAPTIGSTANSMAQFFETCLVAGYGDKGGAGWSMPFEDRSAGIKVFKPPSHPSANYYLQMSGDTGSVVFAKVYTSMTTASDGELLMTCRSPFVYGYVGRTGKWVMMVSDFGFYLFFETVTGDSIASLSGRYFFINKLVAVDDTIDAGIFLQHTSGSSYQYGAGVSALAVSTNGTRAVDAAVYAPAKTVVDGVVRDSDLDATYNGYASKTTSEVAWQAFYNINNKMCFLPGIYIPFNGRNSKNENYKVSTLPTGARTIIHHTGKENATSAFKVKLDEWVY